MVVLGEGVVSYERGTPLSQGSLPRGNAAAWAAALAAMAQVHPTP